MAQWLGKARTSLVQKSAPIDHRPPAANTPSLPGGGDDSKKAGMSVFGGDSWARESQQRKRRLDDLMLPAAATSSSSSSPTASGSFKRLSSGKFACLVCPHRPVLDSSLMLSMHIKGSRHIAAESRLREKELSRQQEIGPFFSTFRFKVQQ